MHLETPSGGAQCEKIVSQIVKYTRPERRGKRSQMKNPNFRLSQSESSKNSSKENQIVRIFLSLAAMAFTTLVSIDGAKADSNGPPHAVVETALKSRIDHQNALIRAAAVLSASPNRILSLVGRSQLAAAHAQRAQLETLLRDTQAAASSGRNPPQAAIDIAYKLAAERLSIATRNRQYHLLPLFAAQLARLSALNNQIQSGNTPARNVASITTAPLPNFPHTAILRAIHLQQIERARQQAQIQRERALEEQARRQRASSWGRGVAQ